MPCKALGAVLRDALAVSLELCADHLRHDQRDQFQLDHLLKDTKDGVLPRILGKVKPHAGIYEQSEHDHTPWGQTPQFWQFRTGLSPIAVAFTETCGLRCSRALPCPDESSGLPPATTRTPRSEGRGARRISGRTENERNDARLRVAYVGAIALYGCH